MPQTSNRIRAKDTSRAEARRRYREEHRAAGAEAEDAVVVAAAATTAAATGSRSAFAMPDVVADIKALPQVFRKPLVWVPFGMLVLAFVLVLLIVDEALPEGAVGDIAGLYVSLTLPPTSLFVFFIGGFVATRASYLVGAILGAFDALLLTILYVMAPSLSSNTQLQNTGLTATQEQGATVTLESLVPLWGIAILVGILAASFAAWYKRFLRSSQERAKVNRALREQEQARKAKEQAKADKQATKDARRTP
ncbi:MAG TPA: hypothetical protein VFF55_06235 [Candidatus Deferrimicrobium sp.]|nr:hypothetical protein [Candidatus Deferrimicrobium sp.]